ncbi:MAG: hypothetical protein M3373_10745 [Gemmatimonadota bacterium]|nr:hypothetical protein [Gemmatimonadota bacterium]
MRAIVKLSLIPAAFIALGCGRPDMASTTTGGELSRDLALAASDGFALAPTSTSHSISAIEAGPPTVAMRPAARKAPRSGTARALHAVAAATDESPVTELVMEPSSDPALIAASPEPATTAPEPTPAPRPAPIAVPLPAGERDGGYGGRRDGGVGGVIGTVIGVVIRGGPIGGEDHCEIHTRGRRGGRGGGGGVTIAINDRIPAGPFPRTGGTFPGGGSYPGGRFPR